MPAKLTKAELSQRIARNCESSLKEGKKLLDVILDAMTHALTRGERIEIRGLGTFGTHIRKTRLARNPKTRAAIVVPAKRVPHFRAAKRLRRLVASSDGKPALPQPS